MVGVPRLGSTPQHPPHAQPPVPGKPGLATGLTAGSSTHRVHAHFTSAIQCYSSPPWSRLTRRCCCPSRVPKPPRGSRPYPRTGPPRCRQKSCRSRFADISVCFCLWDPASAANMGADAEDAAASWHAGRSWLSKPSWRSARGGGGGGTRCLSAVAVAHVGARSPFFFHGPFAGCLGCLSSGR